MLLTRSYLLVECWVCPRLQTAVIPFDSLRCRRSNFVVEPWVKLAVGMAKDWYASSIINTCDVCRYNTLIYPAYFKRTYDVISIVPWVAGRASYYTSSLDVFRQLLGNERNTHLIRPRELTSALWYVCQDFPLPLMLISRRLWGDNLFSANDNEWKRHRRIVAPSFTTKTYVPRSVIGDFSLKRNGC